MNCTICQHGQTAPSLVTVTLERGPLVLVFRDVPAEVCDNCGEQYLSESTTADLLRKAEVEAAIAQPRGDEVHVRSFPAA